MTANLHAYPIEVDVPHSRRTYWTVWSPWHTPHWVGRYQSQAGAQCRAHEINAQDGPRYTHKGISMLRIGEDYWSACIPSDDEVYQVDGPLAIVRLEIDIYLASYPLEEDEQL